MGPRRGANGSPPPGPATGSGAAVHTGPAGPHPEAAAHTGRAGPHPEAAAHTGPAGPDPEAAAHVFVADLDTPVLDAGDAHHLAHVLRLVPDQLVTAGDGAGRWRDCRFQRPGNASHPALLPSGPIAAQPPAHPPITVAFALVKGRRPEWAVQKLTETGVDRIVPVATDRTTVRWEPGRADRHVDRLRRVAREAAMQSRRAWLPEVTRLMSFDDLVRSDEAVGRGALACPHGDPPSLERPLVIVGPEGGWSHREMACGLPLLRLGPTVLRSETAALAAGVLLGALRAGLVSPGPS